MRYTINLATRTHIDHAQFSRIAYCAIVLLLIIAGWNVSRVSTTMGEVSRLTAEIEAIQTKNGIKAGSASEADMALQKKHVRFYNGILERRGVNWLAALDLIENATPDGIALSTLTPGKKQEEWLLEGHARSFKSVRQYLEKLEGTKGIAGVLLQSSQNMAAGEKSRGVTFSISCRIVP